MQSHSCPWYEVVQRHCGEPEVELSPAVFFCCDGQRWSLSASLLPAAGASTSYIACQTSAQITLPSSCAHSACSTSFPPTATIRSAQFLSLCVTTQRWRWGKRRHSVSHSDGVHVLTWCYVEKITGTVIVLHMKSAFSHTTVYSHEMKMMSVTKWLQQQKQYSSSSVLQVFGSFWSPGIPNWFEKTLFKVVNNDYSNQWGIMDHLETWIKLYELYGATSHWFFWGGCFFHRLLQLQQLFYCEASGMFCGQWKLHLTFHQCGYEFSYWVNLSFTVKSSR